jgi:hypothetical protein
MASKLLLNGPQTAAQRPSNCCSSVFNLLLYALKLILL